jgi:hypothetical protein
MTENIIIFSKTWEKELEKIVKPDEEDQWIDEGYDYFVLENGTLQTQLKGCLDSSSCVFPEGFQVKDVIFFPQNLELIFNALLRQYTCYLEVGLRVPES